MSISLQLYTLRDAYAEDPDATLARVAELGLTRVEAFDFVGKAVPMRAALDRAGLAATSGHASLADADAVEPVLDDAATLGIELLIDPMTTADQWGSEDSIKRVAERLSAVVPLAAERGMRVGYHNHSFEIFPTVDGRHGIEILAENLAPEVVLEVDAYWCAVGGADVPALLGRLGGRVAALHIKNGEIPAEPPVFPTEIDEIMAVIGPITLKQQPAGTGDIDIDAVLAAAPADALRVIEFDAYAGDVFDAVAASYHWLAEREA